MFALLAEGGGLPVFIGDVVLTQLVNRASAFRSGRLLRLLINDDQPEALGGYYQCRVRVFRR